MSKEKEYIQELFTKPTETFSEHLKLDDNERIIFSGRFGIGKSTFLNHYFEKEKANYNVIHLYPVNYSVLQNEDIFRYIKYDILLRLLTITPKDSNDQYNYIGFFDGLGSHIIENSRSLFSTFLLLIPELGEQLNQFSKELGQFWKDFKDAPKSETEIENKEIYQFISDIHSKESGIYETGELTQIIQNGLRKLKNVENENILIIDDLDRIDPAHIFRILNVFSAHFDDRNGNSKNKFGFDKIILVCDIDNIRNIYAAIYGSNTDFNGYVDKFFSKEIYRFDNKENILGIIDKLIPIIKINNKYEINFEKDSHLSVKFLKDIIYKCIASNYLNLRNLLKLREDSISFIYKEIGLKKIIKDDTLLEFLSVIELLGSIFGDLQIMQEKLSQLKEFKYNDSYVFGQLLILNNIGNFRENKLGPTYEKMKVEYLDKKYLLANYSEKNSETVIKFYTTNVELKNKKDFEDVVFLNGDEIDIDFLPLIQSIISKYMIN